MNAAVLTLADPYWLAASQQALRAAEEADCVLVPAEFLPLHPRFAPLEFSWGLSHLERLAWCCSKDDIDRLAPRLHPAAADPERCSWSNEVFVLGGTFRWRRPPDTQSVAHLTAWFERLERYRSGTPAKASSARPFNKSSAVAHVGAGKRRVLLVGASHMGNVGDDLLAMTIADELERAGAEVFVSGPDIDPLHVSKYDAVVVGGGGLIYASRDGSDERQNLGNYLKFGCIAEQFGIPAALIGVGDQDHAAGIERHPFAQEFARSALQCFAPITTRDPRSSELLSALGARAVATGTDPALGLFARATRCVRSTARQPNRIALAGELFAYPAIPEAMSDGSLAEELRESEFDLLIMSNDDVSHCQRMQKLLQRAGAHASLVDLRGRDFEALIFLFASYRAVITTRFHGLILAALANVPVATLDLADGKKARLLRELDAPEHLIGNTAAARDVIRRAMMNQLAPIPAAALERVASLGRVHSQALQDLLERARIAPSLIDAPARELVPAPSTRETASSILDSHGNVNLCWAAASRDTEGFANLGDSLSAVIVSALSGLPIRHTNFDEPCTKLVAVGSIAHAIRGGTATIWGSGVSIRGGVLAQNVPQTQYDVRAIRGSISAQHLRDFGVRVPAIYGDPVWVLPSIFDEPVEKKYELGVIPHIQDVDGSHPDAPPRADSLRYIVDAEASKDVALINTWHAPTLQGLIEKVRLIRSCKRIVSQSFHGVVIAEAYGIPVLNFRNLPKTAGGLVRIELDEPCATDPRIWEFYAAGPRPFFHMYNQRRDERSDWEQIIRCVDSVWEPFEYDPSALIESFPLPLAYDPLRSVAPQSSALRSIAF